MKSSGFTLIELLIAIAVIGILAAILIPNLLNVNKKAYDAAALACGKSLQTVEAINQVNHQMFMSIGSGDNKINHTTDGIDQACKDSNMYIVDRSSGDWDSDYTFDIWDGRGSKVITVTPSTVDKNVSGATSFSTSGTNLP